MISRLFMANFSRFTSFSFLVIVFLLKKLKTVAVINLISQFQELLKSDFWLVFDVWPNCAAVSTE